MPKSQTIVRRFVIILQVMVQILLLYPWIEVSTGKCNAIVYAAKVFSSGDAFHVVREGLSRNVDFSYLDEQAASQLIVLFLFEIIMALLIQILSFINLLVTACRKRVAVLDVVCLLCGVIMMFSMINGFVFTNIVSNIYPVIIAAVFLIEFIGARILGSWEEANKQYYESKERDREWKQERKRRLAFPGKYTRLFYRVLWKNFRANKKDFIILIVSGTLSASLIFVGIGMSEILAPFNQEGSILRGHGIYAILLDFLIVSLIISVFLIVSALLSYFGKRVKNYGIFVNLGLRKKLLYNLLGIEIASAVAFTAMGGILAGNLLLLLVRRFLRQFSSMGNEWGSVSVVSYLAVAFSVVVIFVISIGVIREFYFGIEIEKTRFQVVEKEKFPGKFRVAYFSVGIFFVVYSIGKFAIRRNSEGTYLLVILLAGLLLIIKNGWCIFLLHRKCQTKKKYYATLMQYNTFYYRYKTTVRYLFFMGIVPIAVLFLFSKEMISSQIAQKPEELFPYDFMVMATEEDDTFFEELKIKYNADIQSYPMVRISNADNTEALEDYRACIMPQGQHIGVSETTYHQLCEAVGSPVEDLQLSKNGSDMFVVYQQDKSMKAHPIDYLFTRTMPYLHIGQPVESYNYLFREDIFPKRRVDGEKIEILTGAYRRGDNENIIVFSDGYFNSIRDNWKITNWQTGEPIGNEEAIKDVNIHHWPTKLTLMNVDDGVHGQVEKELQIFKKAHAFDETFDSEVLSYYSSKIEITQIKGARLMTLIVNVLIICALQLMSLLIIYLKFESELREKRKRSDLLSCIGMRYKERVQVLKTEVKVYLWVPLLMAVVTVPLLTKIIWVLRQYTKEDCFRYSKFLAVLVIAYIFLQTVGLKLIETSVIRKVEGENERSRSCK